MLPVNSQQFVALDYEIVRGLLSTSRAPASRQPSCEPLRVISLLNKEAEKDLQDFEGISHGKNFFFEDRNHDWMYRDGKLFYFSHAIAPSVQNSEDSETADVLVVYTAMNRMMASDGSILQSQIRSMVQGVIIKCDVDRTAADPGWTAKITLPTLAHVSTESADAIAKALTRLTAHARAEIETRQRLTQTESDSELRPSPAS
jgi:hypothetical protein